MSHYTILYKYGKRTRDFFWAFLLLFQSSFLYFGIDFNKTIIPLALVGYEMIIANEAPRWLSIISYPTRACGIIVKYFFSAFMQMNQTGWLLIAHSCVFVFFLITFKPWFHRVFSVRLIGYQCL